MELNLENETSRLRQLNIRKDHCCCKYCGNDLEIRRMTFGTNEDVRVELYCSICEKIEFGVEKEIYAVAEYFVEEMEFQCYFDIEDTALQRKMNVAKVAEIISWGFVHLGYTTEKGFTYPINVPAHALHEYLNIKLSALKERK